MLLMAWDGVRVVMLVGVYVFMWYFSLPKALVQEKKKIYIIVFSYIGSSWGSFLIVVLLVKSDGCLVYVLVLGYSMQLDVCTVYKCDLVISSML